MNIAIVGAGILGLAHALAAARRGHRVTVVERSPRASGASIRNFGMVWPIGQTPGQWHQVALQSRDIWIEVAQQSGIWLETCGSIHLAHRRDEWEVLTQFAEQAAGLGYECQLLTPDEVSRRSPAANRQGLLGGLFSPTECSVNPPATIRALPAWLAQRYGVDFHFNTAVTSIENRRVSTGALHQLDSTFDRVIVCSGSDIQSLFPQVFDHPGLKLCKLQMLRTQAQASGWRIGTHIASGLTLRHYACFENCSALTQLRQRIADETPELDRFGIHVMASQNELGQVILGDSHEYNTDIEPFDKAEIDELMLRQLRLIVDLPDWTIEERWHGIYSKFTEGPMLTAEPQTGVFVRNGLGGSGMTMSFGLAEQDWKQWS